MSAKCKPIADAVMLADGMVQFPFNFGTGECWGGLGGLQRASRQLDERGRPIMRICAPEDSTRVQLIKVFVKFATEHPERGNEEWFDQAWASLRDAFPCKP